MKLYNISKMLKIKQRNNFYYKKIIYLRRNKEVQVDWLDKKEVGN